MNSVVFKWMMIALVLVWMKPAHGDCTGILTTLTPQQKENSNDDVRVATTNLLEQSQIRQEALDLVAKVTALDRKVQDYKNKNGGHERITELNQRRRMTRLQVYLHLGDSKNAIDSYRLLFRDVEQSYWEIKDTTEKIQALETQKEKKEVFEDAAEKILTQLSVERDAAYKTFGENYGEYMNVRFVLEKIITTKNFIDGNEVLDQQRSNSSDSSFLLPPTRSTDDKKKSEEDNASARQTYVEAANQALKYLGIHNIKALFPELGIDEDRVTTDELKTLFRTNYQVVIAKLEADVKKEQHTFWKVVSLSAPLLDAVKKVIYTLPQPLRGPVSSVLGIGYDIHVRDVYLPDIEMILRSPKNQQLEILRELNARSARKDELLITFIRVVNATDAWRDIKSECETLSHGNTIYKNFHTRMLTAEKKAFKMGDLSLFYEESYAQRLGVGLAAVGTSAVWTTVHYWPQIHTTLLALVHLLSLI